MGVVVRRRQLTGCARVAKRKGLFCCKSQQYSLEGLVDRQAEGEEDLEASWHRARACRMGL